MGLKTHLLGPAVGQPKRAPPEEFGRIPLEPYAPARWQLLNLHRAVNRLRKAAGLAVPRMDNLLLRRGRRVRLAGRMAIMGATPATLSGKPFLSAKSYNRRSYLFP